MALPNLRELDAERRGATLSSYFPSIDRVLGVVGVESGLRLSTKPHGIIFPEEKRLETGIFAVIFTHWSGTTRRNYSRKAWGALYGMFEKEIQPINVDWEWRIPGPSEPSLLTPWNFGRDGKFRLWEGESERELIIDPVKDRQRCGDWHYVPFNVPRADNRLDQFNRARLLFEMARGYPADGIMTWPFPVLGIELT